MKKSAVLVIDVQQGLCEDKGAAHDCPGTISRINRVTEKARAAGVPVIFIQHEETKGEQLEYATPAWQLADGMTANESDARVRKTTCDSFLRTNLGSLLQSAQVNHLIICGMHTEYCVDSTTRSALAHGFPVTLISDAHTSAGNAALTAQQVIAHHNATLPNISSFGPRVTLATSAEIQF
jgi:nicotinamidase-related amidase